MRAEDVDTAWVIFAEIFHGVTLRTLVYQALFGKADLLKERPPAAVSVRPISHFSRQVAQRLVDGVPVHARCRADCPDYTVADVEIWGMLLKYLHIAVYRSSALAVPKKDHHSGASKADR
jgi:hypothetical protein